MRRVGSLEIDEHPGFQWFEWISERLGWLLLGGILVAAGVYGVFGKHPRSERIAGRQNGDLWVEYDRRPRVDTRTVLKVHAVPGGPDSEARVSINDPYLDRMMIEQIVPKPKAAEARADRTVFRFAGEKAGDPLAIRFYLQPTEFGPVSAELTLGDGAVVSFDQQVFP